MKSISELQAIKDKVIAQNSSGTRVVVGLATCGIAAGARPIFDTFAKFVKDNNLSDISVKQVGCVGLCQYEPLVEVIKADQSGRDEKVTYINMDAEKALTVAEKHLKGGEIVDELTIGKSNMEGQ